MTVFKGKYGYSITDWQAYKKIFAGACNKKAIGESSISYVYSPNAAINIKKYNPEIKMISIMRHPVNRAYSKYPQIRPDASEPFRNFEDAIAAEPDRMKQNWSPT